MRHVVLAALLALYNGVAHGQEQSTPSQRDLERQLAAVDFVGTTSVEFFEVSRAGKVEGCSLVYKVVFPDVVYRSGQLTVAVGNITFNVINEKTVGLSLKLGTRPLLTPDAPFEPPNFAFLVTSGGSSARIEQTSAMLDDGFKMFVYSFVDPKFPELFGGLLDDDVISISFNRSLNGVDQRFNVDLTVESSELVKNKFTRKKSNHAKLKFINCLEPLMSSIAN